jgi:hypothetical protein
LSISVRLRKLVRGNQGPIWAVSAIKEEEEEDYEYYYLDMQTTVF